MWSLYLQVLLSLMTLAKKNLSAFTQHCFPFHVFCGIIATNKFASFFLFCIMSKLVNTIFMWSGKTNFWVFTVMFQVLAITNLYYPVLVWSDTFPFSIHSLFSFFTDLSCLRLLVFETELFCSQNAMSLFLFRVTWGQDVLNYWHYRTKTSKPEYRVLCTEDLRWKIFKWSILKICGMAQHPCSNRLQYAVTLLHFL